MTLRQLLCEPAALDGDIDFDDEFVHETLKVVFAGVPGNPTDFIAIVEKHEGRREHDSLYLFQAGRSRIMNIDAADGEVPSFIGFFVNDANFFLPQIAPCAGWRRKHNEFTRRKRRRG